jgi:enoyl-CoA hydratase/carnithine racemase
VGLVSSHPAVFCAGADLADDCEIVPSCDMVVTSDDERCSLPEIKRELYPGAGETMARILYFQAPAGACGPAAQ